MPQVSPQGKMMMLLQDRVLRLESKAIALGTERDATPRAMSGIHLAKEDWKEQPSLRTWLIKFGYIK